MRARHAAPGGAFRRFVMRAATSVVVGLLVLLHLGFFALEAVLWERLEPARKALGFPVEADLPDNATAERRDAVREVTRQTGKVAANQGVSNLFLAAGLAWGLYR